MRFTLDGEAFDLTPDRIRAGLSGQVPEVVREYWVDIDGTRWPVKQVISLATGVTDRQRFQSQSARRWLQNLGFTIGSGEGTVALTTPPRRTQRTAVQPGDLATAVATEHQADVVLVGCVKTKLGRGAPAKDLYVSDYFTKMRAYAEGGGLPWFILSAEHGLVSPDEWLEPYERYLPETSHEYRCTWGEKVAGQLERAAGPLSGVVLDVHAGAAYVAAVEAATSPCGAIVLDQLKGLSFGRRLSWYLHHAPSRADASGILARLRDEALALPLPEVMARAADLRVPGLYSWWVDQAGAAELTAGLGHRVRAGLIYAGLAGATRSGGATSTNTLWGRIATMHLGGKFEFSTLRYSLGSILAEANHRPAIDEADLTRWIYAHLRVMTVPVANVDTLDELETGLLSALDPPLNLAKVPKTPLRQRLSVLRKQYGAQPARAREGTE